MPGMVTGGSILPRAPAMCLVLSRAVTTRLMQCGSESDPKRSKRGFVVPQPRRGGKLKQTMINAQANIALQGINV